MIQHVQAVAAPEAHRGARPRRRSRAAQGLRIAPLVSIAIVVLFALWMVATRIEAPSPDLGTDGGPWNAWPMLVGVAMITAGIGGFLAVAWSASRQRTMPPTAVQPTGTAEARIPALGFLATAPMPSLLVTRPPGDAGPWRAVWANHALSTLCDDEPAELQQRPLAHWLLAAPGIGAAKASVPPPGAGRGPALAQLLDQRRAARCAALVIDRFGRRHEAELTIEPLPSDGTAHRALIMLDHQGPRVARLQARSNQVDALERSLSTRARDTEWAIQELESFSHTVSHDLRQPIRQISGFARILQEDHSELLDQAGRDHINRILNATHRMREMIEALLEAHRISAHVIVRDPVDLSALAQQAADELRSAHPGVPVNFHIEAQVGCRGDKVLLRALIWNLFENAWKYSARSARREIRFSCLQLDGRRVFEVSDNGIGFDMQFADQIFGLFHRLHGRGEFQGSGVGLATVQRIVRRHRGRVWAESKPGQGASFRFTLWEEDE